MVIAIDGPAGAGKSTVARILSRKLGYTYIETGAMYRGVALIALRRSIGLDDVLSLEALARELEFGFEPTPAGNRVIVNGEDVTGAIRDPVVTQGASIVSTLGGVRKTLVEKQRELGAGGNVIMEGRDIGTRVFPAAEVKVFLDASPRIRSERRLLQDAPPDLDEDERRRRIEETEAELRIRDQRDRERAESPLVQAPGALYLDSTAFTVDEVVAIIERLVEERGQRQVTSDK